MIFAPLFFMRFCGFFCSIAVNCAGGERGRREGEKEASRRGEEKEEERERDVGGVKLSHGVLCSAAFLPAVAFAAAFSSAFAPPPLRLPSAAASGLFLLCFNSRGALSTLVILPLMAATCQPLISGTNGSGYGSSSGSSTDSDSANDTETDSVSASASVSACVSARFAVIHSFVATAPTHTQTQQDEPLGGATVPAWRRRQA